MNSNLEMVQRFSGELVRKNGIYQPLAFHNRISAELIRDGRIIKRVSCLNGVTVVGKNSILDTFFGKASPVAQVATWYIGLINNTPTPVLSEDDTLASHAGWAEMTTQYGAGTTPANRQAWTDADASAKTKGTTTVSTFTFITTGTAYGALVASVASGTSGVLWATGAFDDTVAFVASDELRVSYSVSLP